jgi:hypothetical protein
MASSNGSREITFTQVSTLLEKGIADFDSRRAADLGELAVVQTAKTNTLLRERARLAAKYGPNDSRVAALDRDIVLHRDRVRELINEQALASVDPPQVGALGWALNGIVLDPGRQPVPGVTVALYNGETWARQFGFGTTSQTGYFLLQVQDAVKSGGPGPFSARVLRDGKTIHVEARAIQALAGHVEFREIQLISNEIPPAPPSNSPYPKESKDA